MNFIKKARNNLRLEKGVELLNTGRYEESLEFFELVLNSSSLNLLALYNKGLAYYYMKRYEEAVECFDILINLKNKEKAAALAIAAEKATMTATTTTNTTRHRRTSSGTKDKDLKLLKDDLSGLIPILDDSSPNYSPQNTSGSADKDLERVFDLKTSDEKFDLRTSRESTSSDSSISTPKSGGKGEKSNSKEKEKEREKSEKEQFTLVILSSTYLMRGDAKMKLGKREEATTDYEELITFDPKDNSDILVNKGYAYLRLEKFEDAHKYFDEATKMNQKCVSGFCGKATVFLRTGQEYQALKYYNKVLSLNPDFREHVIDHGKVQVIVQSIQDRILEKEKRTIQEFTLASQSTPKDERHNANNGTQPQAKKMQFLIEYNHSKKRLDLEVYSIEQLIAEVSRLINLTSPILLEYWDDDFSEWIDLDDIRYITKMEKAKLKVKPVFGQLAENRNLYIKDISVGNLLGSGSYGEVYKGIWNGTTRVALKKLHQPYDFKTFASEVQVLMQLRHPNIVWFFGLYHSQSGEYFIVTEFLDSGNLRDFLLDKKDLDFSILMHMAANACAGMVYLSSHGVVHRDLSARNLLVKHEDGHYVVKVADFGLSRVVDADYYVANKKSRFPLKWTAVEAIKYGKYSSKSDVWSFGISLWEILEYGAEPYFGLDTQEVKEYIIKGNRLSCPPNCPENIYQLMLKCWNEDPAQRPSFKELFEHIRVYCEYTDLVEKKVPDDETENHTEEDLHSTRWTYI